MPQVSWRAAPDGAYWIDLALGSREIEVLIDLGMIDQLQRIGVAVEAPLYDQMKQANELSQFFANLRLDASGGVTARENGLVTAQLICPLTRQRVGPQVSVYVSRGSPLVPPRVGVVFFHALVGCRVTWDLAQRLWTVEYP